LGGGLLRLIVGLSLSALIIAIVIACWANWKQDGHFSLRVFDPSWWALGKEEAKPLVSTAKDAAGDFHHKLWGEGGWAEQADRWITEQRARHWPAEGAAAGPAPAAAQKSPESTQLETAIRHAHETFAEGMVFYNKGNPANGGWSDEKRQNILAAQRSFIQVRTQLEETIPKYKAKADHDPAILKDAEKELDLDLKLLRNSNKMIPE
jgi:hypothetical protein